MKVTYVGTAKSLYGNKTYEVNDICNYTNMYKIRNECGELKWYSKNNFMQVRNKVEVKSSNISNDLIDNIEKELKETEQRMADLRKKLEDAKLPPTDNILLRATRKNPNWIEEVVDNAFDHVTDSLMNAIPELRYKGLYFGIHENGKGIILDNDYRWDIEEDGEGIQYLVILDKY